MSQLQALCFDAFTAGAFVGLSTKAPAHLRMSDYTIYDVRLDKKNVKYVHNI